jgi:hypothetical protein
MNFKKICFAVISNFSIVLLLAEIITVTIPVAILRSKFNFPGILRRPAIEAFTLFKQNQPYIILGYYIFLVSSLLFIPLSYFLQNTFKDTNSKKALKTLVGLGITTTIFQSIGFIRWIFVMPFLTESYFVDNANKNSVTLIYETINRFAGMSIGEHLGFLIMGSWTICLGTIIINSPKYKKWIGIAGIFIGLLLIISVGEHFGGACAYLFGKLNFIANTIWTFWLLLIAIMILKSEKNITLKLKLWSEKNTAL